MNCIFYNWIENWMNFSHLNLFVQTKIYVNCILERALFKNSKELYCFYKNKF